MSLFCKSSTKKYGRPYFTVWHTFVSCWKVGYSTLNGPTHLKKLNRPFPTLWGIYPILGMSEKTAGVKCKSPFLKLISQIWITSVSTITRNVNAIVKNVALISVRKKRLNTYSCTITGIIEISKTFTIKPNNLIFILPKVFYYYGAYVRLPIYLNIFTKP